MEEGEGRMSAVSVRGNVCGVARLIPIARVTQRAQETKGESGLLPSLLGWVYYWTARNFDKHLDKSQTLFFPLCFSLASFFFRRGYEGNSLEQ